MADEKKFNPVYANPSTQYTSAYPFSSIVFPENVPVMAADLNEMQKNFGSKLGDVIKTLSGSSVTSGNMTWVPVKQEYKQCIRKITEEDYVAGPHGSAYPYNWTGDIEFGWYNADISGFLLINGAVYNINIHIPKFVREDVELNDYISHFQEDSGLNLTSGDTVNFKMFPDTGSISSWELKFSSVSKTDITEAIIESTYNFPYGRIMPENPLKFNAYLVLDESEFTAEDDISSNISQENYPLTTVNNVSVSISGNKISTLTNYLADNDFAEEIARRKGLKQAKVVITEIGGSVPDNSILIFSDGNWTCESADDIRTIQKEYKNAMSDLNRLAIEDKKAWFLSYSDYRSLCNKYSVEVVDNDGTASVVQTIADGSFSFPMLIEGSTKIITVRSGTTVPWYESDSDTRYIVCYVSRSGGVGVLYRDSLEDDDIMFIFWYIRVDGKNNLLDITDTTTVENSAPYVEWDDFGVSTGGNYTWNPGKKSEATTRKIYSFKNYECISKDGKSFGPYIIDKSYTGVKKEVCGKDDFRNVRIIGEDNPIYLESSLSNTLLPTLMSPSKNIVRSFSGVYHYGNGDYNYGSNGDASTSYLREFNSSEVFLSLCEASSDKCISIDSGDIRYKLSTPDKIKYQTFDDSGAVTSEVITSRSSVVSVSCDSFLQSTSDSTTIKGVSVPSGAWYLTVPCGCIQGTKGEIVISDVCFDGIENDSDAYTALLEAYSCVTRVSSTQKGEIIIICSGDKPDINIKIRVAAMYGTDN